MPASLINGTPKLLNVDPAGSPGTAEAVPLVDPNCSVVTTTAPACTVTSKVVSAVFPAASCAESVTVTTPGLAGLFGCGAKKSRRGARAPLLQRGVRS